MACKLIGLSFKNSPEDMELYEWIIKHSGISAFIKDTLRATKENEISKNKNKEIETKKTELIDLDF